MIYEVFIRRPRLAMVISIIIVIIGLIAMSGIPVSQYPDIAPPTVQVSTFYPGADAETIEKSIGQLIEDAVNGVTNMKYMKSNSSSDGSYSLSVVFDLGTDLDIAAVNVQNRINRVESSLPSEVRSAGITVTKANNDMLQVFTVYSPDNSRDGLFLSNYATLNLIPELKRIPGVGNVSLFGGEDYSMRIWIDPEKMAGLKMSVSDVIQAIGAQNKQAAAGRIGAPPITKGQQLQFNIITKGRLSTPKEFSDIILRANKDGSFVRLKDVARVEIAAKNFDVTANFQGNPSAPLATYLAAGANAVSVAEAATTRLDELSQYFPTGVAYQPLYNTADFVNDMLYKVFRILLEAFGLVALVIFIFLGRFRPTIIPLIAVPVAIIGAVGIMFLLGYSANTISLLALVLAIGIVVDDAIIVVENVERVMEEEPDLSPAEATRKALKEIAGSIIAITLVLLAVFVPVAFLPGSSGALLRQFAVTISAAMLVSALNALTLAPALCSLLLTPGKSLGFIRPIIKVIDKITRLYAKLIKFLSPFALASLAVVVVFSLGALWFFKSVPNGFVPDEDKGFIIIVANLPPGAARDRTDATMRKAEEIVLKNPAVEDIVAINGFDLFSGGSASNAGVLFIRLKPFNERTTANLSASAVIGSLYPALAGLSEAVFIPFSPPQISGVGSVGGIEYIMQATQGQPVKEIAKVAQNLSIAISQSPKISSFFTTFNATTPRLNFELDRDKALSLGIGINDIFAALQATLGGYHVNDFNLYGRTWEVKIQAEAPFRSKITDIGRINIKTASGEMVPLSTLATVKIEGGAKNIARYNNYRSVSFNANVAANFDMGEAMAEIATISNNTLPEGYSFAWSGQALEQTESAGNTPMVIGFAFLFAYFFLVALYESWNVPIAVLISVVVAVFGAIFTIWLAGLSFDLYAQIAIVILIALSAKNSILINTFALNKRNEGMNIRASAIEGARLRFRPVMMTSIAFIMGLIPLVSAEGPGAASMIAVGLPVMGGMIFASTFGIIVIPMLYELFQWAREKTGWRPETPVPSGVGLSASAPKTSAPKTSEAKTATKKGL